MFPLGVVIFRDAAAGLLMKIGLKSFISFEGLFRGASVSIVGTAISSTVVFFPQSIQSIGNSLLVVML